MVEVDVKAIERLRHLITENLRIQKNTKGVDFIDAGSLLGDLAAKQNHVVFARRGCGKTLLLTKSAENTEDGIDTIYLNCEDFKRHSFPNVLLEILESVFSQIENHLREPWWKIWGKNPAAKSVREIAGKLKEIREKPDTSNTKVKETAAAEARGESGAKVGMKTDGIDLGLSSTTSAATTSSIELAYDKNYEKLEQLNRELPEYKKRIQDFFNESKKLNGFFVQLDDLYHLDRVHQAFVVDYVHRLCKDLPLHFKLATLRHVSTLYVDVNGQPFGAQERHDYQPVNIDYDFSDFQKTEARNFSILEGFAKKSGLKTAELKALFKGEGFARLVMAGGGVPRDVMSLFLEILPNASDGRIGKDDVRISSRSNFERRIEELKSDSQDSEQEGLIKGIYLIRSFCLDNKSNVFGVLEEEIQKSDQLRSLLFRLLDYRIIHNCGSALTHKSVPGTFQAFAVDIGCYAHLRKLHGRFNEIDLTAKDAKEKMRSCPMLSQDWLQKNIPIKRQGELEEELLDEQN